MAETMFYTGTLIVTKCWCGISHGVPQELYDQADRCGKTVYCPLGHSWVLGDSETKKLKAQLASAREESEHYREQRDYAERQARAHKGHHTRTKNRIANGVCPCCNRTFVNLGKHMKSQHPDFALQVPTKEGLEDENTLAELQVAR